MEAGVGQGHGERLEELLAGGGGLPRLRERDEAHGNVEGLAVEEVRAAGVGEGPDVLEDGDVEAGRLEERHGLQALDLAGPRGVGRLE